MSLATFKPALAHSSKTFVNHCNWLRPYGNGSFFWDPSQQLWPSYADAYQYGSFGSWPRRRPDLHQWDIGNAIERVLETATGYSSDHTAGDKSHKELLVSDCGSKRGRQGVQDSQSNCQAATAQQQYSLPATSTQGTHACTTQR